MVKRGKIRNLDQTRRMGSREKSQIIGEGRKGECLMKKVWNLDQMRTVIRKIENSDSGKSAGKEGE